MQCWHPNCSFFNLRRRIVNEFEWAQALCAALSFPSIYTYLVRILSHFTGHSWKKSIIHQMKLHNFQSKQRDLSLLLSQPSILRRQHISNCIYSIARRFVTRTPHSLRTTESDSKMNKWPQASLSRRYEISSACFSSGICFWEYWWNYLRRI